MADGGAPTRFLTSASRVHDELNRGTDVWTFFNPIEFPTAVNLGQGFMNWAPPRFILDKLLPELEERTDLHHYSHARGRPRLRNAIRDMYSDSFHKPVDWTPGAPVRRDAAGLPVQRARTGALLDVDTEIAVTAGANEAMYAAMCAFLEPGDEVVLFEPFFDQYVCEVTFNGGVPVYVPMVPPAGDARVVSGNAWTFDWARLEEKLARPRAKALFLNTPHNPIGKVCTRAELQRLAALCIKHDILVVADEVYDSLTFDGQQHERIATIDGMWERTLTVGSAGKSFACTGWRIGWLMGAPHLVQPAFVAHVRITFTVNSGAAEGAAIGLELARTNGFFGTQVAAYTARRAELLSALDALGFSYTVPHGSYFVLVDATPVRIPADFPLPAAVRSKARDYHVCWFIAKLCDVVAIPVTAFCSEDGAKIGSRYIRFAFCKDHQMDAAATRLQKVRASESRDGVDPRTSRPRRRSRPSAGTASRDVFVDAEDAPAPVRRSRTLKARRESAYDVVPEDITRPHSRVEGDAARYAGRTRREQGAVPTAAPVRRRRTAADDAVGMAHTELPADAPAPPSDAALTRRPTRRRSMHENALRAGKRDSMYEDAPRAGKRDSMYEDAPRAGKRDSVLEDAPREDAPRAAKRDSMLSIARTLDYSTPRDGPPASPVVRKPSLADTPRKRSSVLGLTDLHRPDSVAGSHADALGEAPQLGKRLPRPPSSRRAEPNGGSAEPAPLSRRSTRRGAAPESVDDRPADTEDARELERFERSAARRARRKERAAAERADADAAVTGAEEPADEAVVESAPLPTRRTNATPPDMGGRRGWDAPAPRRETKSALDSDSSMQESAWDRTRLRRAATTSQRPVSRRAREDDGETPPLYGARESEPTSRAESVTPSASRRSILGLGALPLRDRKLFGFGAGLGTGASGMDAAERVYASARERAERAEEKERIARERAEAKEREADEKARLAKARADVKAEEKERTAQQKAEEKERTAQQKASARERAELDRQQKLNEKERRRAEKEEQRAMVLREREARETEALAAARELEHKQAIAELDRQQQRLLSITPFRRREKSGDVVLTPIVRHNLLKSLVMMQMQQEWLELVRPDALSQYGYPFSRDSSEVHGRMQLLVRLFGGKKTRASAAADVASPLQEPLILRHMFQVHLKMLPGLNEAPISFWRKRIQRLFDEFGACSMSSSTERSEVVLTHMLSSVGTQYLGLFWARGFGVRGAGELRGPGVGDPGTEEWGVGKHWGAGTVKRGLDRPYELTADDLDLINALFFGEERGVWEAAGRESARVQGDWDASKELFIEQETGLEQLVEYLSISNVHNLPPHLHNAVEWLYIHIAVMMRWLLVESPAADDLFNFVRVVHMLFPYWPARQILKMANAQVMIQMMVSLVLAQPAGTKSLFQRVVGFVVSREINAIQREYVEPIRKEINEPVLVSKIDAYVRHKTPEETERMELESRRSGDDFLATLLLTMEPRLDASLEAHVLDLQRCFAASPYRGRPDLAYPRNTPAGKDQPPIPGWGASVADSSKARLFALLKLLLREQLKRRDREQFSNLLSTSLVPNIIKDGAEILFYGAIREIASVADLSARLGDLQNLLDDAIRVRKSGDNSVQRWVEIAKKHHDFVYFFVHECAPVARPLWDWCQAGCDYMSLGTTDPNNPADRSAENLEVNLDEMLMDERLSDVDVDAILREMDDFVSWSRWNKIRRELEYRRMFLLALSPSPDGLWRESLPSSRMAQAVDNVDALMSELMEDEGVTPDDGLCDRVRGTERKSMPFAFFDIVDPLGQGIPAEPESEEHRINPRVGVKPPSLDATRKLLPMFRELLVTKLPDWLDAGVSGEPAARPKEVVQSAQRLPARV
ncbi:hypothetical protein MSPP1_000197 [Malassezia sp. CBS 17886]|nr:hypothetical protein MSPP1_000197 [Malassezia sp. CBS 17886]